jgi:processive 1,2-diacylglycerol beta-glucosyltransferase
MISLKEKGSNRPLGTITEAQLKFLVDQLEEEWLEDQDYTITTMLIEYFEGQGADPALISLLKDALAGRDEVEIVWSR